MIDHVVWGQIDDLEFRISAWVGIVYSFVLHNAFLTALEPKDFLPCRV
jgi:hypothetical protein